MIRAIVLAVLMSLGPVTAQRGMQPDRAESLRILQAFGRCVVAARPKQAEAVLAKDFNAADYQQDIRRLGDASRTCAPIGSRGRFASVLFAGALAEALLARTDGDLTVRLAPNPGRTAIAARGELEVVGLCVTMREPARVAALFATDHASAEEASAFAALTPALTGCIRAGQQVRMNRPGMRAIFATAAYRIVQNGGANVPTAGS